MTCTGKESMMSDHEVVSREEWAAAREELLAREKEHTRLGDELAAARAALGSSREGVPLRHRRRHTQAGGAVRRPLAARGLPLNVRPELRGWLHDLLVDRRRSQRRRPAPARARRDHGLRVADPAREVADVQAAHGLEFPL